MPDSLTKRRLDAPTIDSLIREAFGPATRIAQCRELSDGFFNAAFRLVLDDGRDVVLKVSPSTDAPLLTYERDIMRAEATFFRAAAGSGAPLPELLYAGFERTILDSDFLVLSAVDGVSWDSVAKSFGEQELATLRAELGEAAALLHRVTNPEPVFGYPAVGELSAGSWPEAYAAMLGGVLDDAERYGVELPVPAQQLRALAAANLASLAEVTEPALVHFDLWPGNVFVSIPDDHAPRRVTGLIDGERMIWGDPLMEFVGMNVFGRADQDPDIIAGYVRAGGSIASDEAAERRITLYHLYMQTLLLAETAPRGYSDAEYLGWILSECPQRILAAAARLG